MTNQMLNSLALRGGRISAGLRLEDPEWNLEKNTVSFKARDKGNFPRAITTGLTTDAGKWIIAHTKSDLRS